VIPFRALFELIFGQAIYRSPVSHFRRAGYMTTSRTKDEHLLPLGTKDRLGHSFVEFQNQGLTLSGSAGTREGTCQLRGWAGELRSVML
jgi:hypothetical protein